MKRLNPPGGISGRIGSKGFSVARRRRDRRRGHPTAVLVGLEENRAVLWRIYSRAFKRHADIEAREKGKRGLYNFHEEIVDSLRPILREGVGSVILVSPAKKGYARGFLDHVAKHQPWMTRGAGSAVFSEMTGSASTSEDVSAVVRTEEFRGAMGDAAEGEADRILGLLERRLNDDEAGPIFYSLDKIEDAVFGRRGRDDPVPEHLIFTDRFLSEHRRRTQRLMQASGSRNVRATVVGAGTAAGVRLAQLGGMVLLTRVP